MRIIGLDVGTKTVGVALSDPLGITAQPFETITRKDNNKLRRTYARIEQDYLLHCGMRDLLQLKQMKSLKNAG